MALVQTVRRRQLGAELRRLRMKAGLGIDEAAERAEGWSGTKISRAENAKVAVKEKDVATLLEVYKADKELAEALLNLVRNAGKRGWWQSYKDSVTDETVDLAALEAEASSFRTFEWAVIPGLFQTADYARCVIERLTTRPDANIQALVEVRMARQAVLSRPEPLKVWAVIHEAALCSNVGGPEVMAAQLDRLIDRVKLPNVNVQIMPMNAPVHPGMSGAFSILGFPQRQDLDVVLVDATLSTQWYEEPDEVEQFQGKFQQITAEAMGVEDSLKFITAQRDRLN
ncbi:helix-turn-helix transcriptional regulator [Kitasatospora aureofaciens]|uniref:helix-turn-helix domain-containing protein n=1 Tax=Kitasatospora aureofaciens TaxID=1894 RepID=UPI001C47C658|nr:helix-turn-helix transcriptional regulator [Kitasatospora aureofaciens]MBV6701384.1 helix-turn-helix domain-containing protein [Kitasatospora aureofaciens]